LYSLVVPGNGLLKVLFWKLTLFSGVKPEIFNRTMVILVYVSFLEALFLKNLFDSSGGVFGGG
jgi:hypothetical protein